MTADSAPDLVARWAHYYGDRKMVSAAITYVHLAGVLLGGGFAVATDRASLRLSREEPDLPRELTRLASVHRFVLVGLSLTAASGLLMLFADLKTYLPSALYWTKMGLVALLLTNGYVRLRAERRLSPDAADGWRAFRITSALSLVLWFGILLAGAFLTTLS